MLRTFDRDVPYLIKYCDGGGGGGGALIRGEAIIREEGLINKITRTQRLFL